MAQNQNAKTPVMVLQELTLQKGFATPTYEIVSQSAGSHQNRFDYVVSAAGIQATGSGSSKQIGKHQAAHNALMKLKDIGLYIPAENPVASFKVPLRDESSPFEPAPNYIVNLTNIVEANKIPNVEFTEISGVGPAHKREFTYDCRVSSVVTTATASTKKMAKQIAAKDMIEKLKVILPRMVEPQPPTDVKNQLTDAETEHSEHEEFPMPDRSINIDDLDHTLVNLMYLKNVTYKDLEEDLKICSEESLNKILGKLEVGYSWVQIQKTPAIVSFSLKIDTPFTIWGTGENLEEAKQNSLVEIFEAMDQMMKFEI